MRRRSSSPPRLFSKATWEEEEERRERAPSTEGKKGKQERDTFTDLRRGK